ncbi:MAG: acyl-CoA dehydrogenase family protein, partial [Sciscionella sp.]
MHLLLTDEQQELQQTVAKFLATQSPMSVVREVMTGETGYDEKLWQRLCGELGLAGLAIPEAYGGAGYGPIERSVVLEELGAALTPSPFFSSIVLAAEVLLASDDVEVSGELLPAIARGELRATVAVTEGRAGWGGTVSTVA